MNLYRIARSLYGRRIGIAVYAGLFVSSASLLAQDKPADTTTTTKKAKKAKKSKKPAPSDVGPPAGTAGKSDHHQ
jgi:hypothetical protein